jgi:hypothetical protein
MSTYNMQGAMLGTEDIRMTRTSFASKTVIDKWKISWDAESGTWELVTESSLLYVESYAQAKMVDASLDYELWLRSCG